jgi:hypothetical protein
MSTRSLLVLGGVLAAMLLPAGSAAAADTTKPVLTASVGSWLVPGTLANLSTERTNGDNQTSLYGPDITASSSEAGTATFIGRDGWTGKALGRLTVPITAGGFVFEASWLTGTPNRQSDSYIFPTTIKPCISATALCGQQFRLKTGGLYSVEVYVADVAGNKSKSFKVFAIYQGLHNSYSL